MSRDSLSWAKVRVAAIHALHRCDKTRQSTKLSVTDWKSYGQVYKAAVLEPGGW